MPFGRARDAAIGPDQTGTGAMLGIAAAPRPVPPAISIIRPLPRMGVVWLEACIMTRDAQTGGQL